MLTVYPRLQISNMSNYNYKICKFFQQGYCRNGNNCRFLHKTIVCKFYTSNKCNKGKNCRFLHDENKIHNNIINGRTIEPLHQNIITNSRDNNSNNSVDGIIMSEEKMNSNNIVDGIIMSEEKMSCNSSDEESSDDDDDDDVSTRVYHCYDCNIVLKDSEDLERDLCDEGLAGFCKEHYHEAKLCKKCFDFQYQTLLEEDMLWFK